MKIAPQGSFAQPVTRRALATSNVATAEPECDKAVLTGQILGGLTTGLALGYAGLEAGVRLGFESGAQALGNHPAFQVLSVFTVGIVRAVIGAAVGAAAGATVGAGVGIWAGGALAEKLCHPQALAHPQATVAQA